MEPFCFCLQVSHRHTYISALHCKNFSRKKCILLLTVLLYSYSLCSLDKQLYVNCVITYHYCPPCIDIAPSTGRFGAVPNKVCVGLFHGFVASIGCWFIRDYHRGVYHLSKRHEFSFLDQLRCPARRFWKLFKLWPWMLFSFFFFEETGGARPLQEIYWS